MSNWWKFLSRNKKKTKTNKLTSHDPVFGPEQFDDLADSDGAVNVFHDIV